MGEDHWEKLAAATGIVFVVLVLVGSFIAGQPPKAGDSIRRSPRSRSTNAPHSSWATT
jgi:hypothetical protein